MPEQPTFASRSIQTTLIRRSDRDVRNRIRTLRQNHAVALSGALDRVSPMGDAGGM